MPDGVRLCGGVLLLVALAAPAGAAAQDRALLYCRTGSLCSSYCGTGCQDDLRAAVVAAGAAGLDVADTLGDLSSYRLIFVSESDAPDPDAEAALSAWVSARRGRVVLLADRASDTAGMAPIASLLSAMGVGSRMGVTADQSSSVRCPRGPGMPMAAHPLMGGVDSLEHNSHMVITANPELVMGRDDEGALMIAGTDQVVLIGDATGYLIIGSCTGTALREGGNGRLVANLWSIPVGAADTDAGMPAPDGGTDGGPGADAGVAVDGSAGDADVVRGDGSASDAGPRRRTGGCSTVSASDAAWVMALLVLLWLRRRVAQPR